MAILLTKLLLAPLCVVAVSIAGRRWGIAAAGVLGGLPVVAGPILLVLTLVHGRSFGAQAAAGTLLGLAALTLFVITYGRISQKAGPALSVTVGWTAFLIGVGILDPLELSPAVELILVGTGFAIGLSLLPPPREPLATAATPPWWDLPARALASATLVLILTAASGTLGAGLSGLLAPFPIVTSVLAIFTHAHGGPDQVRVLLRNFLVGFYGFAAFCFVLAVSLPSLSVATAFLAALASAVLIQAAVFSLRRRLLRPQPAEG